MGLALDRVLPKFSTLCWAYLPKTSNNTHNKIYKQINRFIFHTFIKWNNNSFDLKIFQNNFGFCLFLIFSFAQEFQNFIITKYASNILNCLAWCLQIEWIYYNLSKILKLTHLANLLLWFAFYIFKVYCKSSTKNNRKSFNDFSLIITKKKFDKNKNKICRF